MKDKLVTISLFVIGAFLIAAFLWSVFTKVMTKTQDQIVDNLKYVEHY